jgi:hypothetical protein
MRARIRAGTSVISKNATSLAETTTGLVPSGEPPLQQLSISNMRQKARKTRLVGLFCSNFAPTIEHSNGLSFAIAMRDQ